MVKQTRPHIILTMILIGVFALTACKGSEELVPTTFIESEEDAFIGVPNPASFYCQEMGYELDLRNTDGGTEGICLLPNGTECEEWEFLAGECSVEWTFCERQGYKIREGEDGAICTFNNGSTCLEYDFFIGECQPPNR